MVKNIEWRGRTAVAGITVIAALVVAFRPAIASGADSVLYALGITKCNSAAACIGGSNKNGAGVKGSSSGLGNGVAGQTTFASSSSSSAASGVLGQDLSSSGVFDAGVKGVSNLGTGVSGISTKGVGVTGTSVTTSGIVGTTTCVSSQQTCSQAGVVGIDGGPPASSEDMGVVGLSNNNAGVLAESTNGQALVATSTNDDGILGNSGSAAFNGVRGQNDLGVGVLAIGGGPAGNLPVFEVQEINSPTDLIQAYNNSFTDVFRVDDGGNVAITGLIYTAGGCSFGCAGPKQPGKRIVSYAARDSQPTLEDFGEAQLIDGNAHVRLDRTFANATDRDAGYLVFITPEGNSHGLYVTAKTPTGFTVHENDGGTSSLPFSYRIVAKPFGASGQRLPTVDIRYKAPPPPFHKPSFSLTSH